MSDNNTLFAEHSAMVKDLAKSGEAILASLKPQDCDRIHHTLGVNSELAELIIASREWYRLSRDGTREEVEANGKKLAEERGDWEFYLEGQRQNLGIPRKYAPAPEHVVRDLAEVLLDLAVSASLLCDPTKRVVFYRKHEIQATPEQNEAALADQNTRTVYCLQHIDDLLQEWGVMVGVTREEALEANMQKLLKGDKARYKGGVYTDVLGAGRADKGGHDQDLDDAPGGRPDPVDGRTDEEKAAQAAGVTHTSGDIEQLRDTATAGGPDKDPDDDLNEPLGDKQSCNTDGEPCESCT